MSTFLLCKIRMAGNCMFFGKEINFVASFNQKYDYTYFRGFE